MTMADIINQIEPNVEVEIFQYEIMRFNLLTLYASQFSSTLNTNDGTLKNYFSFLYVDLLVSCTLTMVNIKVHFCVFFFHLTTCEDLESKIQFVLHNNGRKSISTFNKSISEQGCDAKGKFAIFTHGWMGSKTPWIYDMISNLTVYRSGCIIFMNYSYYSDRINYFESLSFFRNISRLVTRKLKQFRDDGVKGDQIYMFGYSLGARIVIDAAINFGKNQIGQIDCKVVDCL